MKRPTKVGAYAPDKLLFRSYFGALWRGAKEGDDQEKSIRVVDTDALTDEEIEDTTNAAKATVGFEAPGIYTLREVIEDDGLGLVSDLADGDTLRTLLRQLSVRRKLVPFDVIAKIAVDLCDAVDALHSCAGALEEAVSAGYGGITPDAFVVGGDGSTRLLEPGIEVVLSRSKTYQHHAKRLGYDAPEILEDGDASPASDVFTIGAVIWELVSGKRLMPGATLEVVSRRWKEGPLPRADASKRLGKEDVPSDLADVLAQALAVDPGARFGSPGAMREAFTELDLNVADAADVVEMVQGVAPRRGAVGGRGLGRRSATLVGVGGKVGAPAFAGKVSVKTDDPDEDDTGTATKDADAADAEAAKAEAAKAEAAKAEAAKGVAAAPARADAAVAKSDGSQSDEQNDDDRIKKTLPKPSPRKAPLPKPKAKLPVPARKGPPRLGGKPGLPPRRKPTAPAKIADEPSGVVDELSMSELDSAPPPAKSPSPSPKPPKASPRPGAVEASDELDVDVALSEPAPDSGADDSGADDSGADDGGDPTAVAESGDAGVLGGADDVADHDRADDEADHDEADEDVRADHDEADHDEADEDVRADDDEADDDEADHDRADHDDDAPSQDVGVSDGDESEASADDDDAADDDETDGLGGGIFSASSDSDDDEDGKEPSAAAKAGGLIEPSAADPELAEPEDGSKRNLVIAVVAVAAAFILYVMFSSGDEETDPVKPTTTAPAPAETTAPEPTPEPAPAPEPVAEEPEEEEDAGAEDEEDEEDEAEETDTSKTTPPVAAAPRPRPAAYPRPRPKPRPKPAPKPSTYVPDDI